MARPLSHIKRPPRQYAPPILGSIPSAHDELRSRVLTITRRGRFTPAQIAGALGISVGDQDRFLTLSYNIAAMPSGHRTLRVKVAAGHGRA